MHLRPDRLRVHAAVAADLAAALAALGRPPGADADQIAAVLLRARRELAEIEAALRGAAAAAEEADHMAVAALQQRLAGHP